jgi:hypothetical protein
MEQLTYRDLVMVPSSGLEKTQYDLVEAHILSGYDGEKLVFSVITGGQ